MPLDAQTLAELQRKRALGINPTNKANMSAYNGLPKPKTTGVLDTATPGSSPFQASGLPKPGISSTGVLGGGTPTPHPTPSLNLAPGQDSVRKFFNDNGYSNVGFDKARNMVTVNGLDALTPDKIQNGTSIAGNDALASALSRVRTTQGQNKSNALMGQLQTAIDKPYQAPQFNYDPTTDPVYQAALRRAQANAQTAQNNAMVGLGARGIGNSSSAVTAANQIQQNAYGQVSDTVLPQLFQQAYGRYRDTVGDQQSQHQNQISNLSNLLGINNGMNQQQFNNDQTTYSNQQAQKAANLQAAAQVSNQTGKVITPQADWTGLYRQAANPNTPLTMAGKDQQFNQTMANKTFNLNNAQTMAALTGHMPDGTPTTAEEQRQLGNLWTEAEQTGTIPNQLADMYGIPRGTQTQAAYQFAKGLSMDWYNAQTSRQNANNAQDQTYLDYIGANNKQTAGAQTVPPAAAGQILHQSLSKVIGNDPTTGKPVYGTITDPTSREQAFIETWNTSGVAPGPDTVEMLSKAGYTAAEIAKYQQKYPQAFQPAAQ